METITYLKGDATQPLGERNKIIAHVCSDLGYWGKGFVLAISKRWKEPAIQFKSWHKLHEGFELRKVQFVQTTYDIVVANMVGQHKIKKLKGQPPIRYDAVEQCLKSVASYVITNNCSVHMPRISCGLAGGKWELIEPIISSQPSSNE